MCDYLYPAPNDQRPHPHQAGMTIPNYCQRASQFWVQSLLSSHNSLACSHHLARIVRHIDECAQQFDIVRSQETAANYPDGGDERYVRQDGKRLRMTKEDSNYARVTVKPYARKVH